MGPVIDVTYALLSDPCSLLNLLFTFIDPLLCFAARWTGEKTPSQATVQSFQLARDTHVYGDRYDTDAAPRNLSCKTGEAAVAFLLHYGTEDWGKISRQRHVYKQEKPQWISWSFWHLCVRIIFNLASKTICIITTTTIVRTWIDTVYHTYWACSKLTGAAGATNFYAITAINRSTSELTRASIFIRPPCVRTTFSSQHPTASSCFDTSTFSDFCLRNAITLRFVEPSQKTCSGRHLPDPVNTSLVVSHRHIIRGAVRQLASLRRKNNREKFQILKLDQAIIGIWPDYSYSFLSRNEQTSI